MKENLNWNILILFGLISIFHIGCKTEEEITFKDQVKEALNHFYTGDRLEQSGDLDEAKREYLQSIAISPRPITYYRLAQILIAQDNLQEAEKYLDKAIRLSPSFRAAIQRRMQLDIMQGETVETAQAIDPTQPENAVIPQDLEVEPIPQISDEPDETEMLLDQDQKEQQIEVTPIQDEKPVNNKIEPSSTIGKDVEQIQEVEEEKVEESVSTPSANAESLNQIDQAKYEAAKKAMEAGQWQNVIKLSQEILNENPKQPVVHYNLGYAYIQLKQFEKAEQAFRKATDLDPDFADAYNDRGVVLEYLGRGADAMESYEKAIEVGEHNDAFFNLAHMKEKIGEYKEAIQLYQKYLEHSQQGAFAQHAKKRIERLRRLAY